MPIALDSALAGLMTDGPGHCAASHPGHHTALETELHAGDGVAAPTRIPLQSMGLGPAQLGAVGSTGLGVQWGPRVRVGVSPCVRRDRVAPHVLGVHPQYLLFHTMWEQRYGVLLAQCI